MKEAMAEETRTTTTLLLHGPLRPDGIPEIMFVGVTNRWKGPAGPSVDEARHAWEMHAEATGEDTDYEVVRVVDHVVYRI